jgi:pimeloyl-ACP methyl ester carboxylesterase
MQRCGGFLRWGAAVALWAVVGQSLEAQQTPAADGIAMVSLGGNAVRVQVLGLRARRPGTPLVVFEAGATNPLEVWGGIVPQVAAIAPVVAYDRAGLGRSDWDNTIPTPRHVADRLRRLLQQIDAGPPYVLVGYSWGGMLARYFAGYYPRDVTGLVLVDPGPMVTQPLADNLGPFDVVGAGRAGYDAYWSSFAAILEGASPAVRAEFQVFRRLMETDLENRDLRPIPDVPIVVVVAAKYLAVPGIQLPYDPQAHFQADLRYRLRILQEWALASHHGTLVMSNHTTHAVTREDPGLVASAVQRVLATVSNSAAGRTGRRAPVSRSPK